MAQTVVGMFDNYSEAQQAVEKLASCGISRDRIDISKNSGSSSSSGSSHTHHDDDHENGITRFFKNLFGDDDDNDADKYSHVASRSECVVTVHAQSNDEAENAADILDDNGAIDVDQRASEYGYNKSGSMSSGSMGNDTNSGGFADTSRTVGAFDTGTDAGLSGTASMPGGLPDSDSTTNIGSTTSGMSGTDRTMENDTTSNWNNRTTDNESKKIDVIEENLEVGKREVQSGGVRLRSRIIERPVEESVRLREERVNVERKSVDRPASESDFNNFEERDIEMVEHTEVPVVNKQARVVEEVSLNKEVEERNETINDTVRKTEVDVDNLEKKDLKDRNKNDY